MHDRVCAATVTWARTEADHQLLRTSLLRLADTGLTIVVADRDSGPEFRAFLDSNPQFTVVAPLGPTLVGQVQASLSAALETGAEFILYTESDKALFFGEGLGAFLEGADLSRGTGAFIAARTDDSFATFPPIQRLTEHTINELCGELTGAPGDYSYGPFILNRELVPHLDALAPDAGWGWRHFIFATAARLGYSVTHSPGDYPCPPDQRQEDRAESLHRMRQLEQNIRGLLLAETSAR